MTPTALTADRTYWHVPGAGSWHAHDGTDESDWRGLCGRWPTRFSETADRLPPNAHLCGSCSRVIAARTDIES